ncbi:alpha/beta hydrolase [Floccifex sp.]|uniref:alpha/beta hydrolase n=1 Tax=Floccifex sp. TaxID=2815810 RepID=UPI003F01066D
MDSGYLVNKIKVDGLKLLILKPTKNKKKKEDTPAILWIHGGGYVTGMAEMVYISRAFNLVKKYGAVVISVDYTLATKKAYPAALNDCYKALLYLKENADILECNKNQIMVGGESAGGGLTIALCMYARDQGEVNIAFQMPLYPMIDNRDTPSSGNHHGISWNTKKNHSAWKRYLSNIDSDIPVYAVPAIQTNYKGLPPAYTFIGNKEIFYCETMTYINHLENEGIPVHFDIYPTRFHAFDMLLPFRKISKQAIYHFEKEFLYAAKHYYAIQKTK